MKNIEATIPAENMTDIKQLLTEMNQKLDAVKKEVDRIGQSYQPVIKK